MCLAVALSVTSSAGRFDILSPCKEWLQECMCGHIKLHRCVSCVHLARVKEPSVRMSASYLKVLTYLIRIPKSRLSCQTTNPDPHDEIGRCARNSMRNTKPPKKANHLMKDKWLTDSFYCVLPNSLISSRRTALFVEPVRETATSSKHTSSTMSHKLSAEIPSKLRPAYNEIISVRC